MLEKITSFTIDHNILERGFYLSRVDGDVFTYDLRFKKPNGGDYLKVAAMHSIEHMLATALRNGEDKENVIYFGPMGCRTGFYLLFRGISIEKAKKLTISAIKVALSMTEIPGKRKIECGNYRSHDFAGARKELIAYLELLEK